MNNDDAWKIKRKNWKLVMVSDHGSCIHDSKCDLPPMRSIDERMTRLRHRLRRERAGERGNEGSGGIGGGREGTVAVDEDDEAISFLAMTDDD